MLTLVNAASNNARLLYKSPVLTKNVRISGTFRVNLWMSFSQPKANLTAVLVDLPAYRDAHVEQRPSRSASTRGWLDAENRGGNPAVSEPLVPGTFYRMHFDMQPKRTSSRSPAGGSGS